MITRWRIVSRPRQVGRLQQLGRLLQLAGRARRTGSARGPSRSARLARPSATVANCSISSTPTPDSATARIVGISRLTTTGARPSESSSMSTNLRLRDERLGEHEHLLLAAGERARRERRGACSSSGNSSSAYARPASASSRAQRVGRDAQVVLDGQLRQQAPALGHDRDAGRADPLRAGGRSGRARRAAPCRRVGRSTPPTASTRLDLPAPLGPSSAVTSPGGISSETLAHDRPAAARDGQVLEHAARSPLTLGAPRRPRCRGRPA